MSRLLTWVLRLLPLLGVVLLVVGVFGNLPEKPDDPTGWWDVQGFVVNLASGVTAACFGVPVAFFVLQRLLQQREQQERIRQVVDLTANTTRRLQSLIVGPLTLNLADLHQVDVLRSHAIEARRALKQVREMYGASGDPVTLTEALADSVGDAKATLEVVAAVDVTQEGVAIGRASSVLTFLSEEINNRLLSEGLEPLPTYALNRVSKFLVWRLELADHEGSSQPSSFERVASYVRDWEPLSGELIRQHKVHLERTLQVKYEPTIEYQNVQHEISHALVEVGNVDLPEILHVIEALDVLVRHVGRRG